MDILEIMNYISITMFLCLSVFENEKIMNTDHKFASLAYFLCCRKSLGEVELIELSISKQSKDSSDFCTTYQNILCQWMKQGASPSQTTKIIVIFSVKERIVIQCTESRSLKLFFHQYRMLSFLQYLISCIYVFNITIVLILVLKVHFMWTP